MHLRNVNPYVTSSFSDWSKSHGLEAQPPRATAPLPLKYPAGAQNQQLTGTSSFGMSGVNAHALMEASHAGDAQPEAPAVKLMARRKLWPLAPALHMAQRALVSSYRVAAKCSIALNLAAAPLAFLWDHGIAGKGAILPGTGMFEACLAAGGAVLDSNDDGNNANNTEKALLTAMTMAEPCVLPSNARLIMLEVAMDLSTGEMQLSSSSSGRLSRHCAARFASAWKFEPMGAPTAQAEVLLPQSSIRELKGANENESSQVDTPKICVANIMAPHWSQTSGFVLHPALADATEHLLGAFSSPDAAAPLKIPVSAAALSAQPLACSQEWVHPTAGPAGPEAGPDRYVCALGNAFRLSELGLKALTPTTQNQLQQAQQAEMLDFQYETEWQTNESNSHEMFATTSSPLTWQSTSQTALSTANALRDLQHLLSGGNSAKQLTVAIADAPSVLQAPAGCGVAPSRAATSSSLSALTKAAAMEFSNVAIESTLVSAFKPYSSAKQQHTLPSNIGDAFGSSVEGGSRLRAKLLRNPLPVLPTNTHVMPMPRGSLANLKLVPHTKTAPGPGEVQLAVQAVGLNFRDVLNVLGMYPGDPGPPGGDCAGIVMSVGNGVKDFKAGDAVFGLAPGCIGPSVFVPASLVTYKPEALEFSEAAAAPTIYITVLSALGDIEAGSRVLVHAGTGGVGLAALQLAKALKCQVSATAGAPAKRAHLRSEGVHAAVDSRSMTFLDDLTINAAGGSAVDVVLNSLTSPGMVAASLAGVAPGGKFVEIGKRDIWSHARIAQDRPDIAYKIVAIDFLPARSLGAKMRELAGLLAGGTVAPPQGNLFRLGDASAAFRKYSQAQHIGKLVLSAPPRQAPFSEAGAVVISGGLGSLGLLTASWLAGRKEQHLILLGRSGRTEGMELLRLLRQSGACVVMCRCDTASREDTASCLAASSSNTLPAVHALYNSGGVLADSMFMNQSAASVRTVFAPKLPSTLAMVAAIGNQPVNGVMLFSSAASLFGAPGQANYAAANAALEGYAAAVSSAGVSSTAIQWGAWAIGMANDPVVIQRAKRTGLGLLQPEQGLDGLHAMVLGVLRPVVAAVPVTWNVLLKGAEAETPEFFKEFYVAPEPVALKAKSSRRQTRSGKTSSKRRTKQGAAAVPEKASRSVESLIAMVSGVVTRVLGADVAQDQPLMQAGLDSLGAVELRNALNSTFGLDLTPTITFDHPTISAMAGFIAANLPENEIPAGDGMEEESGTSDSDGEYYRRRVVSKASLRKHHGGRGASGHRRPAGASPLPTASAVDISSAVRSQVTATVVSVLGHDVSPEEPLMQAGLDSLGAVELRNALNARFGLDLVPTVTLDYPTITSLAGHIAQAVQTSTSAGETAAGALDLWESSELVSVGSFSSSDDYTNTVPIAITASTSVLPRGPYGQYDTISAVPLHRWDLDTFASVSSNAWEPRFGSFVPDAESFDATAFSTSRPEAIYMDPQQRLLLERAGELIAQGNTKVNGSSLPARTAVMVGIGTVDYVGMSSTLPLGMYFATGGANSVAAGRLSFTFNLTGSCVSIDTACSSSLVAAHYSAVDVKSGIAEAALVAGVNLTLSPKKAAAFTITGMLTYDGRCKTLDATADGYVRAETCVVHLVQPLLEEGANGNGTAAAAVLILGSAVNQDGRSSSLTAPSGPAQQIVLRDALHAADLTAGDIGGLEMHGTGTALGDPIEVGAALAVFKAPKSGLNVTTFTATKSRMGHAETGAGALGMLSAAMQLSQQISLPVTHLTSVNPYVATILERHMGTVSAPRQAVSKQAAASTGISSFAFQVRTRNT